MSWDVMVFNYEGQPPRSDEEASSRRSLPLGEAEDVRRRISAHLPEVDWSDPAWGVYDGDGFSFEFNTEGRGTVDSLMVHVRGGGNAVAALLAFANPNRWSLLDCSTGEFLDPASPSQAGWEGFQAFRDRTLDSREERREEPGL